MVLQLLLLHIAVVTACCYRCYVLAPTSIIYSNRQEQQQKQEPYYQNEISVMIELVKRQSQPQFLNEFSQGIQLAQPYLQNAFLWVTDLMHNENMPFYYIIDKEIFINNVNNILILNALINHRIIYSCVGRKDLLQQTPYHDVGLSFSYNFYLFP